MLRAVNAECRMPNAETDAETNAEWRIRDLLRHLAFGIQP